MIFRVYKNCNFACLLLYLFITVFEQFLLGAIEELSFKFAQNRDKEVIHKVEIENAKTLLKIVSGSRKQTQNSQKQFV